MSLVAPTLQAFFSTRLISERQASPATITAYRDALRLLVLFAARQAGCQPSALDFSQLDAPTIGSFLQHLEQERHNSVRTRNARLAGVHSLFRFAALRHPEHAASIQRVLAIPNKRYERALVSFLTKEEATALLDSPNRSTWLGRRDHALLSIALQAGLRVGELIGLECGDVVLTKGAHVRVTGKGRKQRSTPLTPQGAATLRAWLSERKGGPSDALFPSRKGCRLTSDAVQVLVAKYAALAEQRCPSVCSKQVTPHVLRHSCVPPRSRRRPFDDCPGARPREYRHRPDLLACRPRYKRKGSRARGAAWEPPWALPALRPAPGIPRGLVIMPT